MLDRVIDLEGVARLIDTVASSDARALPTLLRALSTSDECLEARVILEIAVRCHDPLAPLSTLCRDGLSTVADFHLLLRSEGWQSVRQLCPNARAVALLNLCDEALDSTHPAKKRRRARLRIIRPRLRVAAIEERRAEARNLLAIQAERAERCPNYWQLLQAFLSHALPPRT